VKYNKKTESVKRRLIHCVGNTIADYNLIEQGDRLIIAVSGGKDSWTMLDLMKHFKKVSPISFEVIPVTIDTGFPGCDLMAIEKGYRQIVPEMPWKIIKTEIAKTVSEKNTPGKYQCAFCARLRRGALYRLAVEYRCNKVALGHHADDAIETTLISGFYEGNLTSLPPLVKSTKHKVSVIRPLIRVWEKEIIQYSLEKHFPAISCGHQNVSGEKRAYIKKLLDHIDQDCPKAKRSFFAALHKINPERFLDSKWL
jgi:tRNA 2-thiocytidine biosynthesis protein TtcA